MIVFFRSFKERLVPHGACSVERPRDRGNLFLHSDPVTHSHLRTLRLISRNSAHSIRLLRASSLQDVHLSLNPTDADEAAGVLYFLTHSTSLRHFSTGWLPTLSIEWFCTAILTSIQVSDSRQDLLLNLFSRLDRAQHSGLLPHLRSLALLRCSVHINAS